MSYKDFLSKTFNAVSVLTISGILLATTCTNVAQAMDGEEDKTSALPNTNLSKAINPEKAIHAVRKVKCIIETMQARERDYVTVMEAFVDKFADPDSYTNEKLNIIDPFWSQSAPSKKSKTTTAKDRLKDKINYIRASIEVTQQEFRKNSIVAKNAIQGFQQFINMCDEYLSSQNQNSQEILQRLLDSLLASHLLGLKDAVDRFVSSSGETIYSHLSLKVDEINTHYTQDSRLNALAEVNYIVDYIRPIGKLIKLGVQPDAKDWSFAENLKKYIEGTLTLDEPSVFLLDGFLYKKGIEKANTSLETLKLVKSLNSNTNTGGVFDGSLVEVETLFRKEKEQARKEYTLLFQAHRERVASYIRSRTSRDLKNINKSGTFLESALNKDSQLALAPSITTTTTPKPEFEKPKKKRNKKKKPFLQKEEQHIELPQIMDSIAPPPPQEGEIPNTISTEPVQTAEPLEIKTESTSLPSMKSPQEHKTISMSISSPLNSTPIQQARIKEEKTRSDINSKSKTILNKILNSNSKPFTIAYVKALNAMSKIGIIELKSKRKGDFRKLVRLDPAGVILGKVFAYYPATSTLGHDLMNIYRTFIQQQLKDRTDINLS